MTLSGITAQRISAAFGQVLARGAYHLQARRALLRALAQAVTAREQERRRIRREIHDGLGPLLAAALLWTETAMELPAGSPSQRETLRKLYELQLGALSDTRSLIEGLRPPALDHGGLISALQRHAEQSAIMAPKGSPAVRFQVSGDLAMLPVAVEIAAYRIAQEAISNALKHGGAQDVKVCMIRDDNGLTIRIDDDGLGFGSDINTTGVGLVSINERAAELGGCCVYEYSPDGGTRVEAWLPITVVKTYGEAQSGSRSEALLRAWAQKSP
jgi:two-component system, NarL family, sensor kinase